MVSLTESEAQRVQPDQPDQLWLDFLWMEITAKCNLRCVHCYADSAPQRPLHAQMQLENWLAVLDQASELGCRTVQFIGGEPTAHPDLAVMIEHARARQFDVVEVFTNGTHFTNRLKDVFLRNRVHLAFSVYGSDPAIHDAVTKQPGSLRRTLDSIQWAVAAGLPVRAGIIEMRINVGQLDSTRELLRRLGITRVSFDRIRGVGRGTIECPPDSAFGELCGACWRGKLAVTPTGQVFPCVFSRFCPVGHVEQGLATVLEGSSLSSFRRQMRNIDQERIQARLEMNCSPDFNPPPGCDPSRTCNPRVSPPCGPDRSCHPDCGPAHCSPEDCIPHVA